MATRGLLVGPFIDLAPGVEGSGLAVHLVSVLRDRVGADPERWKALRTMRGAVCLLADDTREALTLRFDYGRVVVHRGLMGVPDVTIRARAAQLRRLHELPSPTPRGLFSARRALRPRAVVTRAARSLIRGDLKIYGLPLHGLLVFRLWYLLSART